MASIIGKKITTLDARSKNGCVSNIWEESLMHTKKHSYEYCSYDSMVDRSITQNGVVIICNAIFYSHQLQAQITRNWRFKTTWH